MTIIKGILVGHGGDGRKRWWGSMLKYSVSMYKGGRAKDNSLKATGK
jgi:hypothetical protein